MVCGVKRLSLNAGRSYNCPIGNQLLHSPRGEDCRTGVSRPLEDS
jgi:hypothetical protein